MRNDMHSFNLVNFVDISLSSFYNIEMSHRKKFQLESSVHKKSMWTTVNMNFYLQRMFINIFLFRSLVKSEMS